MNKPSKREIRLLLTALLPAIILLLPVAGVSAETTSIDLEVSPPIINADGEVHEIIVVQLETSNGDPYIASRDTTVYLTSSNLDVGLVQESVVIPAGKSYAKAAFNASYNSGMSIITASAAGFNTDEAIIDVIKSVYDAQLMVYAAPDLMPAVKNVEGRAIIQILDLDGTPYNSLQDVNIVLTSSNNTILTIQESATIPKGSNYVEVGYKIVTEYRGAATIFAHAPNYEPGSDDVLTSNETRVPHGLRLYFSPSTIQPDKETHAAVTVQLVDSDGNPAKAVKDTVVTLTSSNLNIATVNRLLTIPKGMYHATTSLKTRYVNGETTISASSPGLYPSYGALTVQGSVPKMLQIYTAPKRVIADESTNEIITIQIQDEDGSPIKTERDIPLFLTSSSSDVGSVPVSATIQKGDSYTSVPFTSTMATGQTTILVATQGLEPSQTTVETMFLLLNVTLTTPRAIVMNQTFTAQVNVTSHGLPVEGAEVRWNALGGVVKSEDNQTDAHGVATAQIVQIYEQLTLKAQVAKLGYRKETAQKTIKIAIQTKEQGLTVSVLGFEVNVFILLIIGALIIAVGLGAYVYLKYRRNKQNGLTDLEIYT